MKLSLENRTQSITSACLRTRRLFPGSTALVAQRGVTAAAPSSQPRARPWQCRCRPAPPCLSQLSAELSSPRSPGPSLCSRRSRDRAIKGQAACVRLLFGKGKSDPAGAFAGPTQTPEQGSRHHSGFGKQLPRSSPYLPSNACSCSADARSQHFPAGGGRGSRSAPLSHSPLTDPHAPRAHASAEPLNSPPPEFEKCPSCCRAGHTGHPEPPRHTARRCRTREHNQDLAVSCEGTVLCLPGNSLAGAGRRGKLPCHPDLATLRTAIGDLPVLQPGSVSRGPPCQPLQSSTR